MMKKKVREPIGVIMILFVMAVAMTFVLPGTAFSASVDKNVPKLSGVSVQPSPAIAGQTVTFRATVSAWPRAVKVRLSGMQNELEMIERRVGSERFTHYELNVPMRNPGSYTFEVITYYGDRKIGDTRKGALVVNPAPPPPNVTQVSYNAPQHSAGQKATISATTDRKATVVAIRIPALNVLTSMKDISRNGTSWTGEWIFAKPGAYPIEITAYDHMSKPGNTVKGSIQVVAEDLPPNVTSATVTPPSPKLTQNAIFSATADRPAERAILDCPSLKIKSGMQFKDNKWTVTIPMHKPGDHPFEVTAFNKKNKAGQVGKGVVRVFFDYSQPPPSFTRIAGTFGTLNTSMRSDLSLDIITDRQTANIHINFPQKGGDVSLKRKKDTLGMYWSVRIHMLAAGKIPIEFVAEDYVGRKGPVKTIVANVSKQ